MVSKHSDNIIKSISGDGSRPYGPVGHSKTSVVHMRDQRNTLNTISPLPAGKTPPKREFRAILPEILPPNKLILGTCFVEFEKNDPSNFQIKSKRGFLNFDP